MQYHFLKIINNNKTPIKIDYYFAHVINKLYKLLQQVLEKQ